MFDTEVEHHNYMLVALSTLPQLDWCHAACIHPRGPVSILNSTGGHTTTAGSRTEASTWPGTPSATHTPFVTHTIWHAHSIDIPEPHMPKLAQAHSGHRMRLTNSCEPLTIVAPDAPATHRCRNHLSGKPTAILCALPTGSMGKSLMYTSCDGQRCVVMSTMSAPPPTGSIVVNVTVHVIARGTCHDLQDPDLMDLAVLSQV